MSILKRIESPADLRKLSPEQFPRLCEEIREQIVSVISNVGGHLASNLGVVELTVALHYVLHTPEDLIVWDTSNQTYAHKLLTGRQEQFPTIRQFEGLSGFCKREESRYDTFDAGHAGTGVSAATGFVEAREQRKQSHKVVCVVGDGALTAGLTLEGLQHAGAFQKDMIVILNDNQMSISKNVGAISAYLNRLITGEFCTRIQKETNQILGLVPHIGGPVKKIANRAQELAKGLVLPGLLFEELGFRYVGPIDGHKFAHLLPTLQNVLTLNGPTLLHVVTKKGLGYEPAMKNPVWFHASAPFEVKTGAPKQRAKCPSYSSVAIETLLRLAKDDPRIVAITAAMCEGTGLTAFKDAFPDRFYDVGIAEQHAVTFAAGMAAQGMRPVIPIYSTFLQRAYDQVIHDVATQNLPVTFCIDRGGLVAEDGATHHGAFDLAYLRHIPNMVIMAPADENELQHMVKSCISCNRPVAVRYPRGASLGVDMDPVPEVLPLGKGVLLREGTDIALVAIGVMVHKAVEAAERLEQEGISAAVMNARFVKPLDGELLGDVARHVKCLLTIEESSVMGGFGSAVLEWLSEEEMMHVPTKCVGLPDRFIEQGPQELLREHYSLTADGIYQHAKRLFAQVSVPTVLT
ncbi:MAG: 1-deoxy-D-xylulose-5-phosphate synthase [Nitrospira sp.]|nr:1-deoxy-D-xylulose-5-phosphate synthase [Nitrospira sp.]MDD9859704.1 1-deoxy-D-xylulose-5-phosphate synthase [Nitrospira sp.]